MNPSETQDYWMSKYDLSIDEYRKLQWDMTGLWIGTESNISFLDFFNYTMEEVDKILKIVNSSEKEKL